MFSSSPSSRISLCLVVLLSAVSSSAAGEWRSGRIPSCFVSAQPQPLSLRKGSALESICGRTAQTRTRLHMSIEDFIGDFKVGDKVKLKNSMEAFHLFPNDPEAVVLPAGLEGEVFSLVTDKHPKATPNFPIIVQFGGPPKKFKMHLEAADLEKV